MPKVDTCVRSLRLIAEDYHSLVINTLTFCSRGKTRLSFCRETRYSYYRGRDGGWFPVAPLLRQGFMYMLPKERRMLPKRNRLFKMKYETQVPEGKIK